MYRKMFEAAFADVEPKTADSEFIDTIIERAEKKRRKIPKLAVIIPAAVFAVAAATVTASAAGLINLADVFRSHFAVSEQSDLDFIGMAECDESFDFGEYVLTVRGAASDGSATCIAYDIMYKDERYFKEDGTLKDKVYEITNVYMSVYPNYPLFGGWGSGSGMETIEPVNENTVRCCVTVSHNPIHEVPIIGSYPLKIKFCCYGAEFFGDDPLKVFATEFDTEDMNVCVNVPAMRSMNKTFNKPVTYPNGYETAVESIKVGSLSMDVNMVRDDAKDLDELKVIQKHIGDIYDLDAYILLKDGTRVQILLKSMTDGATFRCDENNVPIDALFTKGRFLFLFDKPIDPEQMEAVEVFGEMFKL